MSNRPVRLLTIGGSDSGGAAGIQADLKTFTALGVYGMSAITVVTAQNSVEVTGVSFMSPDFLGQQLDAVLSDYGTDAVKTGFIGNADLIQTIAERLRGFYVEQVVVDPVLVNHKGEAMFGDEVMQAYSEHLLPMATLITPNFHEAKLLAGVDAEAAELAEIIYEKSNAAVLIKGRPDEGKITDHFFDGQTHLPFSGMVIRTENLHGSGDTLSAVIATYLAKGQPLTQAITQARAITGHAISTAANWQLGTGHGPLNHLSLPRF